MKQPDIHSFCAEIAQGFPGLEQQAFRPDAEYRTLLEWSSLNALIIISIVKNLSGKELSREDLAMCSTFRDLYNRAFP